MSFVDSSSSVLADVKLQSVSGSRCIASYELDFVSAVHVGGGRSAFTSLEDFAARVYLVGSSSKDRAFLGEARALPTASIQNAKYPRAPTVTLKLLVRTEDLATIEDGRTGDLVFGFDIFAKAIGPDSTETVKTEEQLRVPQSEWISLLKKVGFQEIFLFEVPLPIENAHNGLGGCISALREARTRFDYGQYAGVVAACRDAMQALNNALDRTDAIRAARKRYTDSESYRDMSKGERSLLIASVLEHFTQLAHHPSEDGDRIQYDRHEAAMSLGITCSIISAAIRKE